MKNYDSDNNESLAHPPLPRPGKLLLWIGSIIGCVILIIYCFVAFTITFHANGVYIIRDRAPFYTDDGNYLYGEGRGWNINWSGIHRFTLEYPTDKGYSDSYYTIEEIDAFTINNIHVIKADLFDNKVYSHFFLYAFDDEYNLLWLNKDIDPVAMTIHDQSLYVHGWNKIARIEPTTGTSIWEIDYELFCALFNFESLPSSWEHQPLDGPYFSSQDPNIVMFTSTMHSVSKKITLDRMTGKMISVEVE